MSKRKSVESDGSDQSDHEYFKRKSTKRKRIVDSPDPEPEIKMFDPNDTNTGEKLPKHMSKFIGKYFSTFLNEEKMAKVLDMIDMPDDEGLTVPKLDENFREMLNSDSKLIKNDNNLRKVQNAFMRAMAPVVPA